MSQNVGPLDAATGTWISDADPFAAEGAVGPLDERISLAWDDEEDDWDDDEDWEDEDDDEDDDDEDEADLGDEDWDAMFDGGSREPLHRRRHFRDDE